VGLFGFYFFESLLGFESVLLSLFDSVELVLVSALSPDFESDFLAPDLA